MRRASFLNSEQKSDSSGARHFGMRIIKSVYIRRCTCTLFDSESFCTAPRPSIGRSVLDVGSNGVATAIPQTMFPNQCTQLPAANL